MGFELWDLPSRNVAGYYQTKSQALAAVRAALQAHGRDYAEEFLLMSEDARGRTRAIAEGSELVDLALRSDLRREPAS